MTDSRTTAGPEPPGGNARRATTTEKGDGENEHATNTRSSEAQSFRHSHELLRARKRAVTFPTQDRFLADRAIDLSAPHMTRSGGYVDVTGYSPGQK